MKGRICLARAGKLRQLDDATSRRLFTLIYVMTSEENERAKRLLFARTKCGAVCYCRSVIYSLACAPDYQVTSCGVIGAVMDMLSR